VHGNRVNVGNPRPLAEEALKGPSRSTRAREKYGDTDFLALRDDGFAVSKGEEVLHPIALADSCALMADQLG